MKKFLILLCFPLTAYSQIFKPVLCSDTKTIIETLTSQEYKERPVWMGTNESGHNFGLFVNPNTGAWTIVEFKGAVGCILGGGKDSHLAKDAFLQDKN